MNLFTYEKASTPSAAIELSGKSSAARYLGGGTNLVDLMRETVECPQTLIDVTALADGIDQTGCLSFDSNCAYDVSLIAQGLPSVPGSDDIIVVVGSAQ